MEATRGNGYAPVRGTPAMMMMIAGLVGTRKTVKSNEIQAGRERGAQTISGGTPPCIPLATCLSQLHCMLVQSFGEPHSVGMSNCLVGAMWPN